VSIAIMNLSQRRQLEELSKNWVENSFVVYVGQAGGNDSAATLRKRLKQYLDFGKGKPVGHYGGRLIWQIQHHPEILIAWKVLTKDDPKIIERKLIFCVSWLNLKRVRLLKIQLSL
jgi:hypothetical protein